MSNAQTGSNSIVGHMVRTYTTFSGVDITALFDNMQIMTLQGIAISITREKVPIYVFGRSRPVSISRGKRGIAGTLQFVLFDRDALNTLIKDMDHFYYAHADEVNWLTNTFNAANYQAEAWKQFTGTTVGADGKPVTNAEPTGFESSSSNSAWQSYQESQDRVVGRSVKTEPTYMDQIWPFDITLVAQNEYGQGAWSAVVGVEIINEGGGLSMDDLTNEEQATYIAIHRVPWAPLDAVDRSSNSVDYFAGSASLDMATGVIGTGATSRTTAQ